MTDLGKILTVKFPLLAYSHTGIPNHFFVPLNPTDYYPRGVLPVEFNLLTPYQSL